jgi:hypothetical protein
VFDIPKLLTLPFAHYLAIEIAVTGDRSLTGAVMQAFVRKSLIPYYLFVGPTKSSMDRGPITIPRHHHLEDVSL